MSRRHDLARTLSWMREGTGFLLDTIDRLTDTDLAGPSALPGWTRAHVIGHVARNAEALGRLASWARTGVPTPMYADREQRATEIEASAALPPATLRQDVKATAVELEIALDTLDATTWRAEVRSALGRTIPAAEIPWMRVREVWLHAVDLAAGAGVGMLPDAVVDTLLDDVTGMLTARPGCPAVLLVPTDRDGAWRLGPADGAADAVEAPAAELLAWVTGRADAPGGAGFTILPRWL